MIADVYQIVADERSQCLFVFDRTRENVLQFAFDGKFIRRIGGKGQGPGEFLGPIGIAFLTENTFALASLSLQKLFLYDYEGKLYHSFFLGDTSAGYRIIPAGITGYGHRIMVSNEMCFPLPKREIQKAIYVFNRNGKVINKFGNYDTRLKKLRTSPVFGIDCDIETGKVFLGNTFDLQISMYDSHGVFLKSWRLDHQTNATKLSALDKSGDLDIKDRRSIFTEVERLWAIFYIKPYVVIFSLPDKRSMLRCCIFDPVNDSLLVDHPQMWFAKEDSLSMPVGDVRGKYSRGVIFAGESNAVGTDNIPLNPIVQFYRLNVSPR